MIGPYQKPPPFDIADPETLRRAVTAMAHPSFPSITAKYRPWRKLRHIATKAGFDPTGAWAGVKIARLSHRHPIPVKTMEGKPLGFSIFPNLIEQLHRIDHAIGGGAAALDTPHGALADPARRNRFVIRSLMDEAIDSSRIEGAATTREKAIELLRSGRAPKSKSEIMVVNNYAAMQRIKNLLDADLSVEMLCELQRILTEGTLDKPDQAGRIRKPDESVEVIDRRTNEPIFQPPASETLPGRLKTLCEFANQDHSGEHFIHPVVKASILHFLIGYEHPFMDGNGRTARAVFYWAALRAGYRIFEYLVISELILKGFAKYPMAYMDTEYDDGDLTYFIQYKLDIIVQAIARLHESLRREEREVDQSLRLIALDKNLNLRQRLLMEHALRHPKTDYTVTSHATASHITPNTARADLDHLVKRNLMNTYKVGKEVHYKISPKVAQRLAKLEAESTGEDL